MFQNIYPHKIPLYEQKDEKVFEELKKCLRRYNIEVINVYYSCNPSDINKENKVLYIMSKNALGIIPDDDIILDKWNNILKDNNMFDKIDDNLKVVFINAEAIALEKNVRDDKNKVYAYKLVEKKTKVSPYKIFAFTTYTTDGTFFDERNSMYLNKSGYNIVFNTKEDYEKAKKSKEIIEEDIQETINKLTGKTLKRKTMIKPIIRFLYLDLIKDIDEMDKENKKKI